jgi:hypothetical protein
MLYLADTIKEEPFVISFLGRGACREIAVHRDLGRPGSTGSGLKRNSGNCNSNSRTTTFSKTFRHRSQRNTLPGS